LPGASAHVRLLVSGTPRSTPKTGH
jgi:hypothetical protein